MWAPRTPFEQRMVEVARYFPPPPWHPLHDSLVARARIEGERDLSARRWAQDLAEKFPSFLLSRNQGGTDFPIDKTLRYFFLEYAKRISQDGFHTFPSSFNVVESFLVFSHTYFAFDLRDGRDHLLRLDDYLDWYTGGQFPEEPGALLDILPEGLTHSYTMAAPVNDFRLTTTDASQLALFGASMIRHSRELSMMALFGESPAYPEDLLNPLEGIPGRGKESLQSADGLGVKDRYLEEAPQLARVVALVRFDLSARRFNERYLLCDVGPGYAVATDDPAVLVDLSPPERRDHLDRMQEDLNRYGSVFSALASLMFLPAFFVAERDRVTKTTFGTPLRARRESPEVRRAITLLGRQEVPLLRQVDCLHSMPTTGGANVLDVNPPELDFETTGFWRTLSPGEIGSDESGHAIVGRTWVERTDSWASHHLEQFTVRKRANAPQGPNAGSVYVMRTSSHTIDLYKIGRTQLTPEDRAGALSAATGVPTPFEVLAHWEVEDAKHVEREAHRRLRAYRVTKRREFFRAPLPVIIATLGEIVAGSA